MCFTEMDPAECWDAFGSLAETVATSGRATVCYAAPFIPTIPGTDTYTDQLF